MDKEFLSIFVGISISRIEYRFSGSGAVALCQVKLAEVHIAEA